MKQKIIIKVQMTCDKCRTKAMKIAATTDGVNSVAIEGSDKDQLVVIGEGVDSANLTCSLRKKLCHATLLSVEEVKEKKARRETKTTS
uniref:HMA domain-containing protein n=1 Tax=Fagus sylvatica TaxID=28930 RepID=A0A2N9F7Q2_FAGSY